MTCAEENYLKLMMMICKMGTGSLSRG